MANGQSNPISPADIRYKEKHLSPTLSTPDRCEFQSGRAAFPNEDVFDCPAANLIRVNLTLTSLAAGAPGNKKSINYEDINKGLHTVSEGKHTSVQPANFIRRSQVSLTLYNRSFKELLTKG